MAGFCVDCGRAINQQSQRCHPCNRRFLWASGSYGPQAAPAVCQDCGRAVKAGSLRCHSCQTKKQWETGILRPRPAPLRPSEIREMAEVECAWVGALIEGEGHIAQDRSCINVAMTEIEPIATLLRLTGGGSIRYQEKNGGDPRYKPIWWWEVRRKHSVIALLEQISPYLASKQECAQQVIESLRAEVSEDGCS